MATNANAKAVRIFKYVLWFPKFQMFGGGGGAVEPPQMQMPNKKNVKKNNGMIRIYFKTQVKKQVRNMKRWGTW